MVIENLEVGVDLLALLEQEDEEQEKLAQEVLNFPSPEFDTVKHIASVLEKTAAKMVYSPTLNYEKNLINSYLGDIIPNDIRIRNPTLDKLSLLRFSELMGFKFTNDQINTENFPKLLNIFMNSFNTYITNSVKNIKTVNKPTKLKVKTIMPYTNEVGQFKPFNIEHLTAANVFADNIKGFEDKLKYVVDTNGLFDVTFIKSITDTIIDETVKTEIVNTINEQNIKFDDILLYTLLATYNNNSDVNFLETARKFYSINRKNVHEEFKSDMMRLNELKVPNYITIVNTIEDKIRKEFDVVIPSHLRNDKIDEFTYTKFKENLLDEVIHGYFKDKNDKNFKPYDLVAVLSKKDVHDYTLPENLVGILHGNTINTDTFIVNNIFDGHGYYINSNKVVKLKQKNLPGLKKNEIKLFDRVKINKYNPYYKCARVGTVGFVSEISEDNKNVKFKYFEQNCNNRDRDHRHTFPKHILIEDLKLFNKQYIKEGLDEKVKLFEIGDEVKIKPSSPYKNQNQTLGKIIEISNFDFELPYLVEFEDGFKNRYDNKDLVSMDKQKYIDLKMKIRNKAKERKQATKNYIAEVKDKLENIVKNAEKPIVTYEQNINETLEKNIIRLTEAGISQDVISLLLKSYIPSKLSGKVDKLDLSIFEKINRLEFTINYGLRAKNLTDQIINKFGIYPMPVNFKIDSMKEYNIFKDRLIDNVLYGFILIDGEIKPKNYAILLENIEGLNKNDMIYVSEDCGNDNNMKHVSYNGRDNIHIPQNKMKLCKKLFNEFAIGSKVKVRPKLQNYRERWNPTYFNERATNFPDETVGEVLRFRGLNDLNADRLYIKFDNKDKYNWSQKWLDLGYDCFTGIGDFRKDELMLLVDDDKKNIKEKERITNEVAKIITESEYLYNNLYNGAESRLELCQRGIFELVAFGYNLDEAKKSISGRLTYKTDLKEAGLL